MTKITILGGSSVGTPALVLALQQQFTTPPAEPIALVLHGRTADKLAPVLRAAQMLARDAAWLQVSGTSDLAQALTGAAIVVNQVRVGGLVARADDETFPLAHGMLGEETVGAGGFANAVRTIPAVVALARALQKYAPHAVLLSFTNPASVIQYAVTQTAPALNVIGLCDASIMMRAQAARALDCAPDELEIAYAGMHHFSFITRVLRAGVDVTARMLDGLARIPNFEMDADIVRALGVLPTPYFKYFLHPDRMLAKQRSQLKSRGAQLQDVETELLNDYATAQDMRAAVGKRGAKWYDAIIAPVVCALISGKPETYIVNVPNRGLLPWLPADAIVEAECLLHDGRATPTAHARAVQLPPDIAVRVQSNCAYEQLMVQAVLEGSREKALRALLLNPLIPHVDAARAVLAHVPLSGLH